ncbi:MAG: P27 family phage terminase small subunit [Planctomycetota bacterium]
MPSGGHNAKPLSVLKIEGGVRDYHKGRGPSGGEPLRKPECLGEHASWLWDQVVERRALWLSGSDAAALETLCWAFHHMQRCNELLKEQPANKDARCSWVAYAGVFRSLGGAFGLTPSDRARLGEDREQANREDKTKEFLA